MSCPEDQPAFAAGSAHIINPLEEVRMRRSYNFAARLVLVTIVVMALMSLAFTFLRPPFQTTDWTDLVGVLTAFAAGPLALYVAGKALAYVFEIIPGWGINVPSGLKGPLVLLVTIGLMFGSDYALSQMPLISQIAPFYRRIVEVALLYLGTQVQYGQLKVTGMRAARPGTLPAPPPNA